MSKKARGVIRIEDEHAPEGLLTIRRNGRVQARLVSEQDAIEWLADKTGFTQETVAEETRGNSKLVDDAGAEWTVTVEGIA